MNPLLVPNPARLIKEKDDLIKALTFALKRARPYVAHAGEISRDARVDLVLIDAALEKAPKPEQR